MSSRHVEAGAGEEYASTEYVNPADTFCDVCLKTIYDGSLRAENQGGSIAFVCGNCRARAEERYERMTGFGSVEEAA